MSGGWVGWATSSLRRYTVVTARGTVLLLLVLSAVCAGAVLWSAHTLTSVNSTAVPLQMANKAVLQDVTDAENGVRGYVLSGDEPGGLQPYRIAMSYLPQDERELRERAAIDPALADAVAAQEAATDAWFTRYVEPTVRLTVSGSGRAEVERLSTEGQRLFDDLRSANAEVDAQIAVATDDMSEVARRVLFWTLVAVVLVPLLLVAATTAVSRRLAHAVQRPLDDVGEVLGRLREGDYTARAREEGPAEIRDIAAALNLLADEGLRSRDMEDTVLTRIEEIDRVRTELVSTVSHELRTPLTSIQGYLELLDDQIHDGLDETQAAMMAVVRRNLARLQELIGNLLTLSRAEEAGLRLESLDLRSLVHEVVGDMRLTAGGRAVGLRTIQSATPVVVHGDRSQLFRALTNLVSNAVKFSRPGDEVEVRVASEGREARVEVVDEGMGIPAAELEGLGRRFFRASNAQRSEIAGTGLGLRIVQTIVDRHHGSLAMESVEDVGTTVALRLPLLGATGEAVLAREPGEPGERD